MTFSDFLNLPDNFNISFEEGKKLHQEMALNGVGNLTPDQSTRVLDYLDACFLYESVDPSVAMVLNEIYETLKKKNV